MRSISSNTLGIIAEDDSDVDSIVLLCTRIINKKISSKKFVGNGGGKILQKCSQWADLLKQRGCNRLLIIHDSDKNVPAEVYSNIKKSLGFSPIRKNLICIPVQELEAWLLSDPAAIKKGMNLKKEPKIKNMPESINDPKEYLGEIIRKLDRTKIYLNTIHNTKIMEHVSLEKLTTRCPSFIPFLEFVKNNI